MTHGKESILVALVKKARRRNAKKAKGHLFEFLRSNLRSWIENELRKRGVARQDMEDALEDVLTWTVVEELSKLRKPAAIMRFLKYKIQDMAKRCRGRPHFEELVEKVHPSTHPTTMFRTDVAKALGQLPPGYADALVLVYVQGYRYKEAAKALGWKVTVFRKRLELARRKMRVLLVDFKLKGTLGNEIRRRI